MAIRVRNGDTDMWDLLASRVSDDNPAEIGTSVSIGTPGDDTESSRFDHVHNARINNILNNSSGNTAIGVGTEGYFLQFGANGAAWIDLEDSEHVFVLPTSSGIPDPADNLGRLLLVDGQIKEVVTVTIEVDSPTRDIAFGDFTSSNLTGYVGVHSSPPAPAADEFYYDTTDHAWWESAPLLGGHIWLPWNDGPSGWINRVFSDEVDAAAHITALNQVVYYDGGIHIVTTYVVGDDEELDYLWSPVLNVQRFRELIEDYIPSDGDTGQVLTRTSGGGTRWSTITASGTSGADIMIEHNAGDVIVDGGTDTDGTINSATTSLAAVLSATDKTKLDGIEASADVNRTAAELKTDYEGNDDTNAFTDADHTKLDGIATGATATSNSDIDARILDWAQEGDVSTIPDAKIPADIARDAEVPDASDDTPLAIGTADEGTATTYTRSDHVHAGALTSLGDTPSALSSGRYLRTNTAADSTEWGFVVFRQATEPTNTDITGGLQDGDLWFQP